MRLHNMSLRPTHQLKNTVYLHIDSLLFLLLQAFIRLVLLGMLMLNNESSFFTIALDYLEEMMDRSNL